MDTQFALVAGHRALDLVNTVGWRLDPDAKVEKLGDISAVLSWCHQVGLLDDVEHEELVQQADHDPVFAARAARDVRALREEIYAALYEHDETAVQRLAERYRDALDHCRLAPAPNEWQWQDVALSMDTPGHRIVRQVLDLVTGDRIDRLHQCEDHACGWVFIDTSPRRNRRWCSSSDCGDRNRARAYYRRKTTSE